MDLLVVLCHLCQTDVDTSNTRRYLKWHKTPNFRSNKSRGLFNWWKIGVFFRVNPSTAWVSFKRSSLLEGQTLLLLLINLTPLILGIFWDDKIWVPKCCCWPPYEAPWGIQDVCLEFADITQGDWKASVLSEWVCFSCQTQISFHCPLKCPSLPHLASICSSSVHRSPKVPVIHLPTVWIFFAYTGTLQIAPSTYI